MSVLYGMQCRRVQVSTTKESNQNSLASLLSALSAVASSVSLSLRSSSSPLCDFLKYSLHLIVIMTVLSQCFAITSATTSSSQQYLSRSLNNLLEDDSHHVEIERTVEPQVLARLESKFLNLLGMARRPPRRVKPLRVPKYLIDLYNRQADSPFSTSSLHLPGRHTKTANTVRTFYHEVDDSPVGWGHRIKFDLRGIPHKETVTGAELRLFFSVQATEKIMQENNGLSLESWDSVRVIVNDVTRPGGKKRRAHREPIMYPIDSKFVNLKKRRESGKTSFWLTFDVFPAVSRWIKAGRIKEEGLKNHGIVIQVVTPSGQVLPIQSTVQMHVRVTRDTDNPSECDPVLFTYSDDGVNQPPSRGMSRRSAVPPTHTLAPTGGFSRGGSKRTRHRVKNSQDLMCSRQKMYVNFEDVGWSNWIVSPKGYNAHVCAGKCPFPMGDHLNGTNHAVIQALVNSINPSQVPPPCCVPTKYSPVQLLYQNEADKTILKIYNEMSVESCGCS